MKFRTALLACCLMASGIISDASAQSIADNRSYQNSVLRAVTEPVDDLIKDVEHLHPVAMFILAKRLFDQRRGDDATFWLYEGQLRWRSRLAANSNSQGSSGERDRFGVFMQDIGPDINYCAAENVPQLTQIIDQVLAWDTTHADDPATGAQVKDAQRNGLKNLVASMTTRADDIKKAHQAGRQTCPIGIPATADDPFPGTGGALFGRPDEMITDYDPARFASFKNGTTSKTEVAKALGAPDAWTSEKDGSSSLLYSYHKHVEGMPGILSQRVTVNITFDPTKVLKSIEMPKDSAH